MKQPELIYWKGSGEMRSDLTQAINLVGYKLTTVGDIDEVSSRPKINLPGIILVDASGGEAEASQRVIEISAATTLTDIPIIFLSYQATKRSAVLKKTFSKFLAVDIPYKLPDLLQTFLSICPVATADVPKKEVEPKLTENPVTNLAEEVGPATVAAVEVKPIAVKKIVISQKDPATLKASCGGEFFATAESLDLVDDKLLIPAHPNYDQLVTTLKKMTTANSSIGLHARRVAFLAAAIGRELGMRGEDERSVRVAGLFLNWGIYENHPQLINYDMLLSRDVKTHQILGRAFAASASHVRDNFKDEQAARTIEDISRIVLEPSNSQAQDMLGAHCALVPELAERSTWAGIKWDSSGAYRTVRKLLASNPYYIPLPVIAEISRVLCEACSVRARINPPISLTAKSDDQDMQKVIEAKKEANDLFGLSTKSSKLVIDLKAGMKLAEPIISMGGKLLLKANVNLTDDLIQSLWRTSIINPVEPATYVLPAV